jgi:hypothetical protein
MSFILVLGSTKEIKAAPIIVYGIGNLRRQDL